MKVDGDYLWDKSGAPDPEIRKLEEVLGTLRYQPRPLEIPGDLRQDQKRTVLGFAPRLFPALAIAATIATILLGVGLWLGLRLQQQRPAPSVTRLPNRPLAPGNPSLSAKPSANKNQGATASASPPREQERTENPPRHRLNPSLLSANASRGRHAPRPRLVKDPELVAKERREAEAAKSQLLLALRLASAKLNFAQKKTLSINPREPVQNQHKIG